MTASLSTIWEIVFWALTALCALTAALLERQDRRATNGEIQQSKVKLTELLGMIEKSRIPQLPRLAISLLFKVRKIVSRFDVSPLGAPTWLIFSVIIFFVVSLVLTLVVLSANLGLLFVAVISPYLIYIVILIVEALTDSRRVNFLLLKLFYFLPIIGLLVVPWSIAALLRKILEAPLHVSILLTLILLPVITSVILLVVSPVVKFLTDQAKLLLRNCGVLVRGESVIELPPLLVGLATAGSFVFTLSALMVGSFLSPSAYVPQTLQMLLSNVFCDTITLLATYEILQRAVKGSLRFSLVVVIPVDLIVAVFLALFSVWLGLLGTPQSVGFISTPRILMGFSPDLDVRDFGPCFWAMITTLLPTVFYLLFIVFCFSLRMVVIPIVTTLRRSVVRDSPFRVIAAEFIVLSIVFGVFAKISKYIGDSFTLP